MISNLITTNRKNKKYCCAKCGKIMDIKNYHIQLCRSCRLKYFEDLK